jgi:hypothetical protein
MFGRPTASQIASASFASFLPRLRYGITNCAAISFTVCPSFVSSRLQWCELPHASIPIRHGGNCAKNSSTLARARHLDKPATSNALVVTESVEHLERPAREPMVVELRGCTLFVTGYGGQCCNFASRIQQSATV